MAKSTEELLQQAVVIRDEKANKKNTALRVGTLFSDVIQKQDEDVTALDKSVEENKDKLTLLQQYSIDNRKALTGVLENGKADAFPFVIGGYFNGPTAWDDFYKHISDIDALATQKYNGVVRYFLDGQRVDVINRVLDYSTKRLSQTVSGSISFSREKFSYSGKAETTYKRLYDNFKKQWTEWINLEDDISKQIPAIEAATNEAIEHINQNEQSAISNFNAQRVTPEMLSESTKQLIEASGGGTITNLADDEDLESVDDGTGSNVLKFKNKTYSAENFSGLGRVYLRKNMSGSKNILVQAMVSKPNTIYHIQYDYDLNGAEITIPQKCVLQFDGGSLKNGVIIGNDTLFKGLHDDCFSGIQFKGSIINTYVLASYFGLHPNGDGTIENTKNQGEEFEQLASFMRRCYSIEVQFEEGFYGYGLYTINQKNPFDGGSEIRPFVPNHALSFGNVSTSGFQRDPKYNFITKVIKVRGKSQRTVFVNVVRCYIGSISYDSTSGTFSPVIKETGNGWTNCGGGGGFINISDPYNDNNGIDLHISDFKVIDDPYQHYYGGPHPYSTGSNIIAISGGRKKDESLRGTEGLSNLYADRITIDGAGLNGFAGSTLNHIHLNNCVVRNCGREGYGVDGGCDIIARNCVFEDNGYPRQLYWQDHSESKWAPDCTYNNFDIEASNRIIKDIPVNVTIDSCRFGNTGEYGILSEGKNLNNITISNCTFEATKPTARYTVKNNGYQTPITVLNNIPTTFTIGAIDSVKVNDIVCNNYALGSCVISKNPALEPTIKGTYNGELFLKERHFNLPIINNVTINTDKSFYDNNGIDYFSKKLVNPIFRLQEKSYNYVWVVDNENKDNSKWELIRIGKANKTNQTTFNRDYASLLTKLPPNFSNELFGEENDGSVVTKYKKNIISYGGCSINNIVVNLVSGFGFNCSYTGNSDYIAINNSVVNIYDPTELSDSFPFSYFDGSIRKAEINNLIINNKSLSTEKQKGWNSLFGREGEAINNVKYIKWYDEAADITLSNEEKTDFNFSFPGYVGQAIPASVIQFNKGEKPFYFGALAPKYIDKIDAKGSVDILDTSKVVDNGSLRYDCLFSVLKESTNSDGTYTYKRYYYAPPKSYPKTYTYDFPNNPVELGVGETIVDTAYHQLVIGSNTGLYYRWDGNKFGLKTSGTFDEKPSISDNPSIGYAYFCTDRQTAEGATNGIMIYHKGGNIWVDALGRTVK